MPAKLNTPRRPWEPKASAHKPQEGRRRMNNAFYCSTGWIALRDWYRDQHPLCEECEKKGKVKVMDVVDHIKQIENGADPLALDSNNLQSLCHSCHNAKSGRERHGK